MHHLRRVRDLRSGSRTIWKRSGLRRKTIVLCPTCRTTVSGRELGIWKAVCIERCLHGLEGGVGISSSEVSRAYPTETPDVASAAAFYESPTPHAGCQFEKSLK